MCDVYGVGSRQKQAEKSSAARNYTNTGEDQGAKMVQDFRARVVFRRWKV